MKVRQSKWLSWVVASMLSGLPTSAYSQSATSPASPPASTAPAPNSSEGLRFYSRSSCRVILAVDPLPCEVISRRHVRQCINRSNGTAAYAGKTLNYQSELNRCNAESLARGLAPQFDRLGGLIQNSQARPVAAVENRPNVQAQAPAEETPAPTPQATAAQTAEQSQGSPATTPAVNPTAQRVATPQASSSAPSPAAGPAAATPSTAASAPVAAPAPAPGIATAEVTPTTQVAERPATPTPSITPISNAPRAVSSDELDELFIRDAAAPQAQLQGNRVLLNGMVFSDCLSIPGARISIDRVVNDGRTGLRISDPGSIIRQCQRQHVQRGDQCGEGALACVALHTRGGTATMDADGIPQLCTINSSNALEPNVCRDLRGERLTYVSTGTLTRQAREEERRSRSDLVARLEWQVSHCTGNSGELEVATQARDLLSSMGALNARLSARLRDARLDEIIRTVTAANSEDSIGEAHQALMSWARGLRRGESCDRAREQFHRLAQKLVSGDQLASRNYARALEIIEEAKGLSCMNATSLASLETDFADLRLNQCRVFIRQGLVNDMAFQTRCESYLNTLRSDVQAACSGSSGSQESCIQRRNSLQILLSETLQARGAVNGQGMPQQGAAQMGLMNSPMGPMMIPGQMQGAVNPVGFNGINPFAAMNPAAMVNPWYNSMTGRWPTYQQPGMYWNPMMNPAFMNRGMMPNYSVPSYYPAMPWNGGGSYWPQQSFFPQYNTGMYLPSYYTGALSGCVGGGSGLGLYWPWANPGSSYNMPGTTNGVGLARLNSYWNSGYTGIYPMGYSYGNYGNYGGYYGGGAQTQWSAGGASGQTQYSSGPGIQLQFQAHL